METTEVCKKQVRLIATDMDGTLLNELGEISQENREAIKAAQAKGIKVVVATGRSYKEAVPPLQAAGITCPIICVNGAEIRDEQGEKVKSVPLSYPTYRQVAAILEDAGIYYELYTDSGTYSDNREKAFQTMVDYLTAAYPDYPEEKIKEKIDFRFARESFSIVNDYDEVLDQDAGVEIYKLLVFSNDEAALAAAAEKLQQLPELAVSSSAKNNLELTNRGAQKGIAVKEFAAQHQILLEETMALGDNFNDLSMLKIVGYSVAMGNAEEEIKQICTFVANRHDKHGVAHAIQELALV
ncbi:Cof-type HAD-IIB family hydrolase [Brevibacillus migulae]|uniref:Cof-type HAD-IIB family hydrolase n=1 Tax=Brevibacillus migulae TaxID=1644114 RepID=UPI00106E01D6|nr:Cof-type HAD-IIB family hydrolase [Brevibacillus migulae]